MLWEVAGRARAMNAGDSVDESESAEMNGSLVERCYLTDGRVSGNEPAEEAGTIDKVSNRVGWVYSTVG